MDIFKKLHKKLFIKKYFKRIFVWTLTVSLIVISLFSIVLYFNIEKVIIDNEYLANNKMLTLTAFNLNYIDENIENVSMSLFMNPKVRSIMYGRQVNIDEVYDQLKTIQQNISYSSSFIKTIYIFNDQTKTLYSSIGNIDYKDSEFKNYISDIPNVPSCRLLLRKNSAGKNVLSYFIYEYSNNNSMDGAIIVDVNIDLLISNLNAVNMTDNENEDDILLLDRNGAFLNTDGHTNRFLSEIKSKVINIDNKEKASQGIAFKQKIEGKEYLITYKFMQKNEWTFLRIQPYYAILKHVQQLKIIFLLITILFLLLIVVVSIITSRKIYSPISYLLKHLSAVNLELAGIDEIALLENTFTKINNEVENYKFRYSSKLEESKKYLIRKIVLESYTLSVEDLIKSVQDYGLEISVESTFVVCVIKIDDYNLLKEKHQKKDWSIYKFSLINIFNEVIAENYKNEAVDLDEGHIAIIIEIADDQKYISTLKILLKNAQEYYFKYFKISVSASISDLETDIREITHIYNQANENLVYEFIFGRMSIISEEDIEKNKKNKMWGFSEQNKKKLEEAIKLENIENVKLVLDNILNEFKKFNFNNTILSITGLLSSIVATIDEMNAIRILPITVDYRTIIQGLFNAETIQELDQQIIHMIESIIQTEGEIKEKNRNLVIVESIKRMIEEKYFDNKLCTITITDALNLSPKYLSRIFKINVGLSIQEYINNIRLENAIRLLENSNLSISDISNKIGMENENYFYTLFKKKFGVTPREYSLNKRIGRI